MVKKLLIGVVSFIVLAVVGIYFMTQPTLEEDGSYSPSSLALNLGTVSVTDFENIQYTKYKGERSKILAIFTEHKNLELQLYQIKFLLIVEHSMLLMQVIN